MNADQHISNIVSQTTSFILSDIGNALNGSKLLSVSEMEEKIALAVKCAMAIGYEKCREDLGGVALITKSVVRLNMAGEEMERYQSIRSASRDVNSHEGCIRRAIRQKTTAGGYKWKYA